MDSLEKLKIIYNLKRTILNPTIYDNCFTKETNNSDRFWRNDCFFFTELTILFLNERENERNRYKMDDHFENELHSL